jgi:hypothetical protein
MSMRADAINSASGVTGAIRQAARQTGANFEYLLATAKIESNFNPAAMAPTSSAGGLYQFIEQTWLSTLKQAGPALGYGNYADAITRLPSGRYAVADPGMRTAIMRLRKDPAANALMAGVFTRQNAARLKARIGRDPSDGELYIAHFLGSAGAAKLIDAARADARTSASSLFPNAARSNRAIFFDKQGQARSVGQVYGVLLGKYDVARAATAAPAIASAAPDTAGVAKAFAAAGAAPVRATVDDRPVFHSLFRTGDRREPVAPAVNELWGQPTQRSAMAAPVAPAAAPQGGLLDLFHDQPTGLRRPATGGA